MHKEIKISSTQARVMLMRLCSSKEMCRADLIRKLDKWGIPENEKEKILKDLMKEKFFCDKRYTVAFISDKLKFQRWGRIKITHALKAKKISEDIIEEVMEDSGLENYMENLEDLLRKKLRASRNSVSEQQIKARLYRFALGRGYEPELIFKTLNKLFN